MSFSTQRTQPPLGHKEVSTQMMFTTQEGCHRTAWAKDDACSLEQMAGLGYQPFLSVSAPAAADYDYPGGCRFFLAHFEKGIGILKVPARTSTAAEILCITPLGSLALAAWLGTSLRLRREASDTGFHFVGSSDPRHRKALFSIDSERIHKLVSHSLEAPKPKGQGFVPSELQGMALTAAGWA